MLRFRHRAVVGLAGVLGALAFAAPAQAEIKADCFFEGRAKTYDKDSWPSRVKEPIPVTGGSGIYEFLGPVMQCIGTAKSIVPEIVLLDLRTSGWYDNVVCFSAGSKAYSHPGGIAVFQQLGGSKDYAAAVEDEKYKLVVNSAGEASFYWHEWNKPKMPLDPKDALGNMGDPLGSGSQYDEKEPEAKDWQLAGELRLEFDTGNFGKPFFMPDVFRNECVDAFRVTGVVHFEPRTE